MKILLATRDDPRLGEVLFASRDGKRFHYIGARPIHSTHFESMSLRSEVSQVDGIILARTGAKFEEVNL